MSAAQNSQGSPGLIVRLADAYRHNGEGQPCEDAAEDIAIEMLRADFPGLGEDLYRKLASELTPEALEGEKELRDEALHSLLRAEQADVLKLILFRVWEAQRPRLSVGSLLLAVGIKPLGISSERDLAKQQNISPEHVSNCVEDWQVLLNLPRTDFQKSAQAVAAARLHNQTRKNKEAA